MWVWPSAGGSCCPQSFGRCCPSQANVHDLRNCKWLFIHTFSVRHIIIRIMGHKIILSKVKLCNLRKHILKTLAHMAEDPLTREMLWIPFTVPQLLSAGVYNTQLFNYMLGVVHIPWWNNEQTTNRSRLTDLVRRSHWHTHPSLGRSSLHSCHIDP